MDSLVPFVRGSDTSAEAAQSKVETYRTDCERVLAIVKSRGEEGVTNDELKVILHDETSGPTVRVKQLIDEGRLRDSGQRRLSRSMKRQRVVILGEDPAPIHGAPQDRATTRPSVEALERALAELRRLWGQGRTRDPDLRALGVWIADLVRRERVV